MLGASEGLLVSPTWGMHPLCGGLTGAVATRDGTASRRFVGTREHLRGVMYVHVAENHVAENEDCLLAEVCTTASDGVPPQRLADVWWIERPRRTRSSFEISQVHLCLTH